MTLPEKPGWIAFATASWLFAFPAGTALYVYIDDLHQRSSYFGWQGTAILALSVSIILGLVLVLPVTAYCVRHYNPKARLLAWRRDRLLDSVLATAGCVFVAAASLWAASVSVLGGPGERLLAAWFAGWVAWALVMRALIVDRPPAGPPGPA